MKSKSVVSLTACATLLTASPPVTKGDVLEGPPMLTVPIRDGSGVAKVGVTFNLTGLRQGVGFEINEAFVEFTVAGLPPDGATFRLAEIVNAWSSDGVSPLLAPLPTATSKKEWELASLDLERVGGLVRLDAANLVKKWVANPALNHGIVIETPDGSEEALVQSIVAGRLIVRYGFSGPMGTSTSLTDSGGP